MLIPNNIHNILVWSPKITDFPTKSGMTLADATQLCTRAIQNSDTIKQCVSRVGLSFDAEIEACVEDIKVCVQGLS